MPRRARVRLRFLCGLVACAWLAGAWPLSAQEFLSHPTIKVAERSDEGVWFGTWYYTSRDFKIALWIRTVDDTPQVKLRYLSLAAPEGFETDWSGWTDYLVRSDPATFALRVDEGDVNTIKGRWEWDFERGNAARIERGRFTMYRTGDGRSLVMRFEELTRIVRRGNKRDIYEAQPAWTFRKASKRHVLWDELPF